MNKVNIYPVGLLNLSRVDLKKKRSIIKTIMNRFTIPAILIQVYNVYFV